MVFTKKILALFVLLTLSFVSINPVLANQPNLKQSMSKVFLICLNENEVANIEFGDLTNLKVNGQNYIYEGYFAVVVGNAQNGHSYLAWSGKDNTDGALSVSGVVSDYLINSGQTFRLPTKPFQFTSGNQLVFAGNADWAINSKITNRFCYQLNNVR